MVGGIAPSLELGQVANCNELQFSQLKILINTDHKALFGRFSEFRMSSTCYFLYRN